MRLAAVALVIVAAILLSGCDVVFEERRLEVQTEADLRMRFAEPPELVARESFGWVEEGGDRALLRVAARDCTKLGALVERSEPADATSDYMRMFEREGIVPSVVRSRSWSNRHGDSKHYVLDPASCVLYREAFFE